MPRAGTARVAALGVAGIALMGAVGVLYVIDAVPNFFNLDGEYTAPAFYSGALLLIAAAAVLSLARMEEGLDRTLLLLTACFLAFLALDEVFSVHERIDDHTGIDWQLLYAPLALAFAWEVWRITGSLGRRSPEARMIFAGAAAWALAQVLEAAAYSQVIPSLIDLEQMSKQEVRDITHSLPYYALSIPEELLEMAGSLLFAVAFAHATTAAACRVTKMPRRNGGHGQRVEH